MKKLSYFLILVTMGCNGHSKVTTDEVKQDFLKFYQTNTTKEQQLINSIPQELISSNESGEHLLISVRGNGFSRGLILFGTNNKAFRGDYDREYNIEWIEENRLVTYHHKIIAEFDSIKPIFSKVDPNTFNYPSHTVTVSLLKFNGKKWIGSLSIDAHLIYSHLQNFELKKAINILITDKTVGSLY